VAVLGLSLVLTAAGLSAGVRGGPKYGIDFNERTLMYLRFNSSAPGRQNSEPPSAKKIKGEITCKRFRQAGSVVGTEIADDKQGRQIIEDVLRAPFGGNARQH